ncbi:hypothetical protein A5696_16265 [Mycobacterium sp. E2699]|nr:hypothetical protein A5696_16265 [Mycobacterium sp. E2699]
MTTSCLCSFCCPTFELLLKRRACQLSSGLPTIKRFFDRANRVYVLSPVVQVEQRGSIANGTRAVVLCLLIQCNRDGVLEAVSQVSSIVLDHFKGADDRTMVIIR